jgi:hypothetical protein
MKEGLLTIFLLVVRGHDRKEFKNVYVAGLILMCELEYDHESKKEDPVVFKDIIQ